MSKRVFIKVVTPFLEASLVKQILVGLILGIGFAYVSPVNAEACGVLGSLFITALKSVAPLLVFVLVMSAIANHDVETKAHVKPVLMLYVIGTFAAALVAVAASFTFPSTLHLIANDTNTSVPTGVLEVLRNLVFSIVDNPIKALMNANYIGILAWAAGLGLAMRHANETSRQFVLDLSRGVENVVRAVIHFAPIGIFGLVANTVATTGLESMLGYVHVLTVLLGSMLFVALIVNPLIVWIYTRRNPYPLTLACLRESGVTAFFTRSSAANIPVNLALCRRLDLDESTYSITIPLGATINMAGAAISISVLALAAAFSLGVEVDFLTALLLCVVASVCACGTSGVPGGSLMLIPLACSLFGIDSALAMQVVAVGFEIGVLQDSTETALNSSSDVLFTATACIAAERRMQK